MGSFRGDAPTLGGSQTGELSRQVLACDEAAIRWLVEVCARCVEHRGQIVGVHLDRYYKT